MTLKDEMNAIRHMNGPAELLLSHRYLREINFQDNTLRDIQCKEVSGKAVRLIHNGRVGTAPGGLHTPLDRLLDTARMLSGYARPEAFTLPEADGTLQESSHSDPNVPDITMGIARDLAERLISIISRKLPEWSLSGGVIVGEAVNRLITSRGIDQRFEERAGGFYVQGTLPREGDILEIVVGRSLFPDEDTLEAIVDDLVWRARQAETVTEMPTGEYPLLIHPEALDSFLEAFSQAVNGRTVFEGISPLKDSLGRSVFDERISLLDDPLDKTLAGYSPFGDEGSISAPVTLVEKGRLKSFLTNLDYASRLNHPHTGHGSRFPGVVDEGRPSGEASISGSSWVMAPGESTFSDMMKDIKDGLYLLAAYDIWSGNLISGDISGSTHLAYRIQNGRPVGRVKDMRVSGNLYSLLGEQLLSLSKERPETSACGLRAPFLLLDRVTIA